jgi:hypothetical protein
MSFFCCWFCSHWRTLASSKTVLHSSRSSELRLQFLTQMFYTSFSTDPSHINLGFPTRRLPYLLSTVSLLQGSSSCILNRCPSQLILPIFNTLTVKFIVESTKLVIVSRSPHIIIVNWTYIILNILLSKIRSVFPSFFERGHHSLPCASIGLVRDLHTTEIVWRFRSGEFRRFFIPSLAVLETVIRYFISAVI